MPYATVTDMLDRFDPEELAQRADRAKPRIVTPEMLRASVAGDLSGYTPAEAGATAAAIALIQRALNDAHSTVDGRVSGRYTVPLADPPAHLNQVVCDIARFLMYDDQVTDVIAGRNKDALNWLKEVSTGAVSIGLQSNGTEQPNSGSAEMVSSTPVWRRDESTGYI